LPDIAVVEPVKIGFCAFEVKLLGPDQLYTTPGTGAAMSDNGFPEQTGPLLLAAAGGGV